MTYSIQEIKDAISKIGAEEYKDGSSTKKGWTYHDIPFEEFNTRSHKNPSDEFDCIKRDIKTFSGKSVLDIGCASGFFSFNAVLDGASDVLAYEADQSVSDVNVMIAKYKDIKNISFVNRNFNDVEADKLKKFDICIFLNIHMWVRKQIGEVRTKDMMKKLSRKVGKIYFQTAHEGAGGKYIVPEFKSRDDVVNYLKDSGFKNVEVLQKSKWQNRYLIVGEGNVQEE